MSRLYAHEVQQSGQPPLGKAIQERSVQRVSWSSPRCNVGAGPAQTDPQVPPGSWGWGGGLAGPGISRKHGRCQRRGRSCGLRASLGPRLPGSTEAGWELRVGPRPVVISRARPCLPRGPEGVPLLKGWAWQICGQWPGELRLGPPGVGKSPVPKALGTGSKPASVSDSRHPGLASPGLLPVNRSSQLYRFAEMLRPGPGGAV